MSAPPTLYVTGTTMSEGRYNGTYVRELARNDRPAWSHEDDATIRIHFDGARYQWVLKGDTPGVDRPAFFHRANTPVPEATDWERGQGTGEVPMILGAVEMVSGEGRCGWC